MGLINYASAAGARRSIWIWVSLAVLAGGTWAWFVIGPRLSHSSEIAAGQTWVTVQSKTMDISFRQSGELQSVNNVDINCPVMGQNTIQTIVPEGTFVKKDDVIATLDSTEFQRNVETAQIDLEKCDADVKWAIEQKRLQESKNIADLEAANSELALAKITLMEYTDGEYPADMRDAERKLEMAKIKLKRSEQDLAATKKLMDGNFSTQSEVDKAQLDVITSHNELEKADSDLLVLREYKHAKDLSEKQDKVAQSEKKVARTLDENTSNLKQKDSDLRAKQNLLSQAKMRFDRYKTMFEKCTIKAPSDGMVLYASTVQTNYYRDTPIQPGAKIYQEQMMIRLPDVAKMKAVVKIPESRVARLRMLDQNNITADVSIVGVPKAIGAKLTKIAVLPDNSDRYINPDAKDYPVDLNLDETPQGLKPGASAQVTIHLGRIDDALAVPLGTMYTVGNDHWVFTRPGRPELPPKPLQVTIGEVNETLAQIVTGLSGGQQLLMLEPGQGRQLLDLAGIKTVAPAEEESSKPTTRPASPQRGPTPQPQPPPPGPGSPVADRTP